MCAFTPLRVDIVSDVVCPWCVIGYHQLAHAANATVVAIDVHWHPFELNPNMVQEGENLREHLAAKYGTTPEGSRKARARLTEMGAALGFTFNYADDMRMVNTFRAHQLIDIISTPMPIASTAERKAPGTGAISAPVPTKRTSISAPSKAPTSSNPPQLLTPLGSTESAPS